ncbi:deoxycytidylate deaminase-like isoform X1 [Condylostylus longicornis]|uniref:deoxycytidylate deaminase-like isoform X1 n=1 Tax=Condylostylus longicornis TaxID=2530218 RepID=UPI00244DF215|nr:deoxycytidylate deaminase-like isoform X1 [Condylostylus longicornis]
MSYKRKNYLEWEEYFMLTALLTGQRSKDPNTQVGACIVDNQNRIIGVGYNGFPKNCSDDIFPWKKTGDLLEQKYMYVVHAEVNAILNKNTADTNGSRLYVSLFPCNECAKLIIQGGIKEIIYISDKDAEKPHTIAAKRMFDAANVKYRQYFLKNKSISFDSDIKQQKIEKSEECLRGKEIFYYPFIYLIPFFIYKCFFSKN